MPQEPPPTPEERLQLRRECAFAVADPGGHLLEIGAAHNGILPKRDGYRTKIVDYLSRAGLVKKYAGFPQYSPESIEEVDFVISAGAPMSAVIPERFDLILASHVLEHTTSLVHFLNDCTDLLADGGVLALVVPDRRYCFDRFRERSSLARVIDAYHSSPAVHTPGTLTEFYLNAVKHRGSPSWVRGHRGTYAFSHTPDEIKNGLASALASTEYVDVHNWVFTPHHLRLLLHDLHQLGYIRLRESFFRNTMGHEFFLNLQVEGPGSGLSRVELLTLADAELTEMEVPDWAEPPPAPEADAPVPNSTDTSAPNNTDTPAPNSTDTPARAS